MARLSHQWGMKRLGLLITLRASFWHFLRRLEAAELDLIAAGVAFYAFLAIFPAAAAIIAIWGLISDADLIRQEVALLRGFLPDQAFALISEQIDALLSINTGNVGLATVLSTGFAIWSARAGVAALIRGLNAVHNLPNRAGHWHQMRALVMTLGMVGLVIMVLITAVVLPIAMAALPLDQYAARVLTGTNLALGTGAAIFSLGVAYRIGPNYNGRSRPPLLSWGLLVALVLWATATRLFILYLENFQSFNRIYGSIGAVVVLLMWLYVSAYAVLLGAAVDAERGRNQ
jgi:membrane protein